MNIDYQITFHPDPGLFEFKHTSGYEFCVRMIGIKRMAEGRPDDRYDSWFRDSRLQMAITPSELDSYPKEVMGLKIDPNKRYLEVGPGLGGFIPYLIEQGVKPTAVDIADYELMREILLFAASKDIHPNITARIKQLAERCDLILDPNKVNFINKSLVDAMADEDLDEPFDVVVDVMAAEFYRKETSNGMLVKQLERALVIPGGELITFP